MSDQEDAAKVDEIVAWLNGHPDYRVMGRMEILRLIRAERQAREERDAALAQLAVYRP